jgi:hypothetical protein
MVLNVQLQRISLNLFIFEHEIWYGTRRIGRRKDHGLEINVLYLFNSYINAEYISFIIYFPFLYTYLPNLNIPYFIKN